MRCSIFALGFFVISLSFGSARANSVLIVSDIHFDPTADAGGALTESANTSVWNATLAAAIGAEFPAVKQDSNWALTRSALDAMKMAVPEPDLVLFTGDFLVHKFRDKFEAAPTHGGQSFDAFAQRTVAFLAERFRAAFPRAMIAPVLGNNDDACGDYMIQPDGPFLGGTASTLRSLVGPAFDNAAANSWHRLGSYQIRPPGFSGLRILLLDNTFWSVHYQNHCSSAGRDPGLDLVDWLARQLQDARAAHEKVWLIFHIPPGVDAFATMQADQAEAPSSAACGPVRTLWAPIYEARFKDLLDRYQDVVVASFAGHTHKDEYKLVTKGNQSVGFVLQTPGISPIFGQNPGFRVISASPEGVIENSQIYALSNSKRAGAGNSADWQLEYDFGQAWGYPRLDLQALRSLTDRIHDNDADRTQWARFFQVSSERPEITPARFPAYYCAIMNGSAADFAACYCGKTSASP